MKKLDLYILKKFIVSFVFAIMILVTIACVIDYSEKVEDFVKKQVPALEVLNYFKNFIPHITALLFPLFLFLSTIFFTSRMAYRSEIIAILASGTSYQRFLRPYIIGGMLMCLISLIANHYIVPAANKQRLAFENKYINYVPQSTDKNVHLRLRKDLYIYVQKYDFISNSGYRFTAETIDGIKMKEKLMADRVSYDTANNKWILYNVKVRKNDSLHEEFEVVPELTKEYPFTPRDLEVDDRVKEALTTPELNHYIATEKLRGRESLSFFYVEKHRRSAQPFAAFILTIMGACIASRKVRGGSGLHLAIGVIISVSYIMALQLTNTYATKAGLNPLLATWIPNIIYGAIAVHLFIKQIR